jgi:predicted glycosyltransferase
MFKNDLLMYKQCNNFHPDLFTSFGSPYAAQVSKLYGKKHISFSDTDSEVMTLNHFTLTTLLFSEINYVPSCHRKTAAYKQGKFNGYYELAYLHPDFFSPNPAILEQLGLSPSDTYTLIRLAALNAHHDVGVKGFNFNDDLELLKYIKNLEKYGKVFISSEKQLSPSLDQYKLDIPANEFHNFMFYASLYIGEGASMASEAAILGVPSIYVSTSTRGYLEELELKYDLAYTFSDKYEALVKAENILTSVSKNYWSQKRIHMLNEKVNTVSFMVDVIENSGKRSQ